MENINNHLADGAGDITGSVRVADRKDIGRPLFNDQMDRIWKALGVSSDKALAKLLGKAQTTISAARTKKAIPESWLGILNRKYDISLRWIMLGEGPMRVSPLPQPLPAPTISLDGFPSDAEFHEAKGFSIHEDLNVAAKVLVSDTSYAMALHLNIRSFGEALSHQDEVRAMKETLRDQSRTIMQLQEEAETAKQEVQKESLAMRKEVEELKTQLARLLSEGDPFCQKQTA